MQVLANRSQRTVFALVMLGAVILVCGIPTLAQDKEIRRHQRQQLERAEQQQIFLEQQTSPTPMQRMALTTCSGGFAGVYPCSNVDLMAFMPLATIGGGSGNDIWGWTDPQSGKEYALMGRTSGTSFVDITDPENPIYLGNLPASGANSSWRDIKVYSNHAYIVSEAAGHGMQVFDLTLLRNVPSPPQVFTQTAYYDDFGSAHNLAINEDTGFAYAVGTTTCSEGLHFIDLAIPAAPVFAGCHTETVYTHDSQCVVYTGPDTAHQNREICINSNENKITVVDVTNKATPIVLSQTSYSQTGYTHQGWLTEDQRYFLAGDELDEQNFGNNTRTRIFDMLDLDAPVLIGTYDGTTTAIDHNMYTHNGYVYQANYRAGLQILDLVDVASGNLTEVANFDIYPSSNSASFSGAWSVYPYFDSGTVVVSGIGEGLFILRPSLAPEFDLDSAAGVLSVCDPGDASTSLSLTDRNGYVGNVTLSASGLPVGASDGYTVNPVAVPGNSQITITTAGVTAGAYPFTVTADDGTLNENLNLTLNVSTTSPGQPVPVLPQDGSTDTSRTPTLEWSAATQGLSYELEVATELAFSNIVYSTSTSSTSHMIGTALDASTTYFWRVRASNACGLSTYSSIYVFTTALVPGILLVDDDDNGPDVRASYIAALNALGLDFDVWDTLNSDDEPSVPSLAPYNTVIWFTGDEYGGSAGPGPGGESALETWLDASGCLLINSQDYYYDRNLTAFMQSHLGLASVANDVNQVSAQGQGSVFSGLGPYSLLFPYTNYTDDLTVDLTAEIAFAGSQGNIGIDKSTPVYRTSFLSFGLETLATDADREVVLGTFLNWCAGLDGDSDGEPNVSDCDSANATVWDTPSDARNLQLGGGSKDNLSWQVPVQPGGTTTAYDVLRSDTASDFSAAVCVESGDLDTAANDPLVLPLNQPYFYLIRARNSCGGSIGQGTLGPRTAISCP